MFQVEGFENLAIAHEYLARPLFLNEPLQARDRFHDGERRYIGRIGIHDESGDYEQLLMDWRASAARPFYLATAASPADVRRRRHIKTRGRTVVSVDDEVLDLTVADPGKHEGLTGESALLAAISASR